MNVYVIFAHECETGAVMGIEPTLEKAIDLVKEKLVITDFKRYQPQSTDHITHFVLGEKELGVWIEEWEVGNTKLEVRDRQFVSLINKYGDEVGIEP